MRVVTLEDHRAEQRCMYAKRRRGWDLTWLPGYTFDDEPQCAALTTRRTRGRYWSLFLDYYELDLCDREGLAFARALDAVGPDPRTDLWAKHYYGLAKNASLTRGAWRWWFGNGLPEGLINDLREMLVARYAAAQALYDSWPKDEYGNPEPQVPVGTPFRG
jgi:hypothetical protein